MLKFLYPSLVAMSQENIFESSFFIITGIFEELRCAGSNLGAKLSLSVYKEQGSRK